MIKPKLIFGNDNGFCILYDINLDEYNSYRNRINKAWGSNQDKMADKLEKELESHEIEVDWKLENGYVPDYVGYIAKAFNIDTESN